MTTATTKEITNSDDVIDVRDVIARVEELEGEVESEHDDDELDEVLDAKAELATLAALLEDLSGNSGDEEWRGAWYPVTLIRESHFREYAEELAEDIGAINSDAAWPNNHIDWDAAADELKVDYTTVELDGVTYWYR